ESFAHSEPQPCTLSDPSAQPHSLLLCSSSTDYVVRSFLNSVIHIPVRAISSNSARRSRSPKSSHRPGAMYLKCGISIALLAVAVGVYLLPSPIDPEPFTFEKPPPPLVGSLAVNRKLQQGRRIFYGQLKGPESFTTDNEGDIYTGTVDGKLWVIRGEQLFFITQMGQNVSECGTPEYEPICGRPHGIRMAPDGYLIVADSYFGLYRVHPQTGEKSLLISNEDGLDKIPFRFLNGLEVSKNGTIYFTDSSSKWGRRHHRYEVLETNHLGRLIQYDPVTQKARSLLDNLYMANGIALSPEEDFILVAETSICRIVRYWLTGTKAGMKEVFVDNLPGYPDNIRISSMGTYRVGLSTTRFPGRFTPFLDAIAPYPVLKRLIVKVIPLSLYSILLRKHGLFLEVGDDGKILASFHDPDGTVTWAISDVFEHGENLYIGNTELPFLVILPRPQ
ncbi:adipocyte plasma membrane-associated protein-like, partial [Xenopus laevis]|uniref:Adipocyte plasma membrane-associated protein-like n=1 Tax=Xenopus laevis TaxID=8355 RepID=A0A8J1MU63_XENLA